jgi:hypothetical protein
MLPNRIIKGIYCYSTKLHENIALKNMQILYIWWGMFLANKYK